MNDSVKTKKGTDLPLMKLKGKDYMMVAYRMIWFNEEVTRSKISTEFLLINDEQTICKAVVQILNEEGNVIKEATGTKRETRKDFPDHSEKAETGAIGRAITALGYGTAYALADLDEGDRIIDAPLAYQKPVQKVADKPQVESKTEQAPQTTSGSSFLKPKTAETTNQVSTGTKWSS